LVDAKLIAAGKKLECSGNLQQRCAAIWLPLIRFTIKMT
jgi:hypothetical protein